MQLGWVFLGVPRARPQVPLAQEAHSTSTGASRLVTAMEAVLAWGVLGLLELEWRRQGGVTVGKKRDEAASEALAHGHFIPKLSAHK